jgi:spermidine/putrescine transport system permease protein
VRSARLRGTALAGPALLWWAGLLVLPVGLVLAYSFFQRGEFGGVVYDWTLGNYDRAFDPLYLKTLGFSVRVSLEATLIALLIGYPTAAVIASVPRRWRTALLVLIVLPFWTSLLIRTYAWIVLLNDAGLINSVLGRLGLADDPVRLLYGEFAIVLGLVYGYLPLMVLPIYAAIERLGPELREASADLGASGPKTFFNVTLPLTSAGVFAGCIFVFVPSLGNFIVPDLLGGGRKLMIGNVIQAEFLRSRDWPFGATLAVSVIAMLVALVVVQAWLGGRQKEPQPDVV